MSNRQYQIYGIGAALVDSEIDVNDDELRALNVEKGMMTLVDANRQQEIADALSGHMVHAKSASGGSACNSVVAASYFGSSCFYSCKVAADADGDLYLGDIRAAGVGCNFDAKDNRETGITGRCLVLISPDAERSMNTNLAISETLSVSELDREALAASEYVYIEGYLVTSPTGLEAAIEARRHAEANGVKTSLSFSDPGMVEFFRDNMAAIVGDGLDLIFCNVAEAEGWAGSTDQHTVIAAMKQVAKQFVITRGADGAMLFDGEQLIEIESEKITAVDSNGAGDMFAGAFLHAITSGHDFASAGRFAAKCAATVVSQYGPRLRPNQYPELLAAL